MDISVSNTDEQKLMPISSVSIGKTLKEDKNTNPTDTKQQTLIIRLFSRFRKIFSSFHLPHLSDKILRMIFLIFITLIGVTSFTIALIVGSSIVQFKQQCPLYATFKFQIFQTSESNWTVKIVPLSEKFSSQSTCDFCTFFNVFTFIYCIMTGFFFILFNGDHRIVTTNDRCLIIPWFPISLILGFFSLINASILTNGFLKFCSTITSNDNRVTFCTQLNHLFFEQYPKVASYFFYMLIAIIFSWVQLIFFIGIMTILTIRLGTSFDWNNNNNDHRTDDKSMNIGMQSMEQT